MEEEAQSDGQVRSDSQARKRRGPYKQYYRRDDRLIADDNGVLPLAKKIPRTTLWRMKKSAARKESSALGGLPPALSLETLTPPTDCADLNVLTDVQDSHFEDNAGARLADKDILEFPVCSSASSHADSESESDSDNSFVVGDYSKSNVPYANSFSALHEVLQKTYGMRIGKGNALTHGRGIEVTACAGEILQMLLTVSSKHNFSNQALLDVVSVINGMFRENVLPQSQHLLDKLLFIRENFHYFFLLFTMSGILAKDE